MGRRWIDSKPRGVRDRELEREVFQGIFGYRAIRGVKAPRFTEESEITQAVIIHVEGARKPQEFRVWRRLDGGAGCAVEALIRTGPQSAYGGSGPTRGVAVCPAALFLAAKQARKRRMAENASQA